MLKKRDSLLARPMGKAVPNQTMQHHVNIREDKNAVFTFLAIQKGERNPNQTLLQHGKIRLPQKEYNSTLKIQTTVDIITTW